MKNFLYWLLTLCLITITIKVNAQEILRVLPNEIDDVLFNPGIGFTTHDSFEGDLKVKNYPVSSIAYFKVYWNYMEPEQGKYNWDMIDNALKTAQERNQTLMFRIMPHGPEINDDVPGWYREMVGDENESVPENFRVDVEDPHYAEYFGRIITEFGKRYDGHPALESVDISIISWWGEGSGSNLLSQSTREALVNSYTDNFKKTPLMMLLTDEKTNKYGLSQANVGWRVDCLGDMGGFKRPNWSHMMDYYPQGIINCGMEDAWKKAPVSFEVCWVMGKWYDEGWDVDYIIDQSLKWHISSFNGKSSEVPKEWGPSVNRWLKKMGYRFVLRNFSCPASVSADSKVSFKSWWENKGVAPCYKDFQLAFRLKSKSMEKIFITDADIREWLPGDIIYDNAFFIPKDFPAGNYNLQVGIIDKLNKKPIVKLAIEGREGEGWYQLGKIEVTK